MKADLDHPCPAREKADAKCRMLRHALSYANKGYSVFPCNTNKAPETENGFKDATQDREQIIKWWTDKPGALIGTPTGKAGGFIAIDLDSDKAAGIDGVSKFAEIVKAEGSIIKTRKHQTPRGGYHLLFKYPGERVKNTAGTLAPGIDTRADGGYLIMPPSESKAGKYKVLTDIEPAPLPPWLIAKFRSCGIMENPDRPPEPVFKPVSMTHSPGIPPSAAELMQGAPQGERNSKGLKLAILLRDEGHLHGIVTDHLLAYAANCKPPLPKREARAIVNSVFTRPAREPARNPAAHDERVPRYESKQATAPAPVAVVAVAPIEAPEPWEAPIPLRGGEEPLPRWDWDVMPEGPLKNMAQEMEQTHSVAPEMAATSVLGAASIALANKVQIEIKRDHKQYANLFLMVVAPVAAGKTPIMKAATEPFIQWQQEQREVWKQNFNLWQANKAAKEAEIKGHEDRIRRITRNGEDKQEEIEEIRKKIHALNNEIETEPPEPVLFCADATSEALGRRMVENSEAIGVLSGEARKILQIAKGRYVEGGDIDLWLAGHAGDFIKVDRASIGKISYQIKNACLAACIMTQPDSLQSIGDSPALSESGFLARWLYLVIKHKRGEYPLGSVSLDTARQYSELIRALIDMPRTKPEDGGPIPWVIKMEQLALHRWKEFHDETQKEIEEQRETKPGIYLQWLGKLPEHIARLALLYHCCQYRDKATEEVLTCETINKSIELADILKGHALKAFNEMGADPAIAKACKVWGWIDKNRNKLRILRKEEGLPAVEAVKPRDIDRAGLAGIKNSREAEASLLLLTEKGYLQVIDIQKTGTKSSRIFYIHPPDNSDKPDNQLLQGGESRESRKSRVTPEQIQVEETPYEYDAEF